MARPHLRYDIFNMRQAVAVFGNMDVHDKAEVIIMGGDPDPWERAAEYRNFAAIALFHHIVNVRRGSGQDVPFAVLTIIRATGHGVASAGLVAASHQFYRRELAELAITLREELPAFADENELNRIECRCYADHPTASSLLRALGFRREARLAGYGPDGSSDLIQFAWTRPQCARSAPET